MTQRIRGVSVGCDFMTGQENHFLRGSFLVPVDRLPSRARISKKGDVKVAGREKCRFSGFTDPPEGQQKQLAGSTGAPWEYRRGAEPRRPPIASSFPFILSRKAGHIFSISSESPLRC